MLRMQMPKITFEITGLSKNLDRDDRIEGPIYKRYPFFLSRRLKGNLKLSIKTAKYRYIQYWAGDI